MPAFERRFRLPSRVILLATAASIGACAPTSPSDLDGQDGGATGDASSEATTADGGGWMETSGAVCDSSAHESSELDGTYRFDLDCALAWLQESGCDFALDPNLDGTAVKSSTIEDMHNDPVSCVSGSACSGCEDDDSLATVSDCVQLAAFSYFTESAWADLAAQCPAELTELGDGPDPDSLGCTLEGLTFDHDQMTCALSLFATMDCETCMSLFDSRICEDAFNDPLACQAGTTCTGCDDGDARANGVDCAEIEAYSYFGAIAAATLLQVVTDSPCDGSCSPDCTGRTCGDDGCGGSCGACGDGEACDLTGTCAPGGCAIEGVFFGPADLGCVQWFFESMDCASCAAVLDSRVCEDAIGDAVECQVGTSCTGCDDADSREDGVTCDEIAAYAYFGPVAAQDLYAFVRDDASCGSPDIVVEGVPLTPEQATAILELANGATESQLRDGAGLDLRAAQNTIAARPLVDLTALAAVSYVGQVAIEKLRDYAPIWPGVASGVPFDHTVRTLADEAVTAGTSSPWFGQTLTIDRAIVTTEPTVSSSGNVRLSVADPRDGDALQLVVFISATAGQDVGFLTLFDDVTVTGEFTEYYGTWELLVDDPALHGIGLNKSGLRYPDYGMVQAAYHSTAANPEGAVRVESTFGYTYMVPLPLFLDHPMWGGAPPAPPNDSGNEQDYAWNSDAQSALVAWQAEQ